VFITSSLDPTSIFEGASMDVLKLYANITGEQLDLEDLPEGDQE